MTKRKVYHVVHLAAEDGWAVRLPDGSYLMTGFKKRAIEEGRKLAKGNQPSQLVIHKKNGVIQREFTYQNDPRRYPG